MPTRLSSWLRNFSATTLLCMMTAACTQPAQPSEDFTRAHARFVKLYAKDGDDAFLAPEMAGIESDLRLVPSNSLDTESARELLQRIQKGRAEAIARNKETEQASARAVAPPPPSESEEPNPPRRIELAPPMPVPGTPPPQAPGTQEAQARFSDSSEEEKRQEARMAEARALQQAALAQIKAREEASWRRRFQEANNRITQIQNKIQEVQRGRQSNGMPVVAFQTIKCDLNKTNCTQTEYNEDTQRSALEQLKSTLTQAQNALADLEREASAKSVPREWRR